MRDVFMSPTFRDRFEVEGRTIEIQADHRAIRRPARPMEMVRAMSRGRAASPYTQEEEFSWRVIVGHRCVGTVRRNPNGTFAWGHRIERDLRTLACAMLGLRPPAPANAAPGRSQADPGAGEDARLADAPDPQDTAAPPSDAPAPDSPRDAG